MSFRQAAEAGEGMMKDMPLEEIRTGPLKGDVPLKDTEALIAPLLIVASVLLPGVRAGLEAERSEGFYRRLFGGGRDERGVC